jgi:hypothetical protein
MLYLNPFGFGLIRRKIFQISNRQIRQMHVGPTWWVLWWHRTPPPPPPVHLNDKSPCNLLLYKPTVVTQRVHVPSCIICYKQWSTEQESFSFPRKRSQGQSHMRKYVQCLWADFLRCKWVHRSVFTWKNKKNYSVNGGTDEYREERLTCLNGMNNDRHSKLTLRYKWKE